MFGNNRIILILSRIKHIGPTFLSFWSIEPRWMEYDRCKYYVPL